MSGSGVVTSDTPTPPVLFSGGRRRPYLTDVLSEFIRRAFSDFPHLLGKEVGQEVRTYTNNGVIAIIILEHLIPQQKAQFPQLENIRVEDLIKIKDQFIKLDKLTRSRNTDDADDYAIREIGKSIKEIYNNSRVSACNTSLQTTDTLKTVIFYDNMVKLALDVLTTAVVYAAKEAEDAALKAKSDSTGPKGFSSSAHL